MDTLNDKVYRRKIDNSHPYKTVLLTRKHILGTKDMHSSFNMLSLGLILKKAGKKIAHSNDLYSDLYFLVNVMEWKQIHSGCCAIA